MKTTFELDIPPSMVQPKEVANWFFQGTGSDGDGSFTDLGEFQTQGTFAQAKKAAQKHFRSEAKTCGRVKELIVYVG